ncbi:putative invertase inhibitor [Momordica charantia]|uniref:Invertase inhibitor n=1 Tax=Momordica charantia TaxID=3673 RepID=A0A6J1C1M8_MOMCH|nr:putative invertase inhibitor [Momordica charantia]
MNPISILVPILVLSLCQFQILADQLQQQQPAASGGGGNELITKTCTSTPYKDFCISILQSSPKSNGADLYGLAEILMETAAQNVSSIYESINHLQNDSSPDAFMEQCLADCLESFQDAIDQIEDSVTALEFKAYNDIKTWVSAAMSDAATCDQGFKDRQGYQSPVAQMTAVFDQICSIILAVTHLLAGK